MDREEFYIRVAQSLGACQFVEEVLKVYFSEARELAVKENEKGPKLKIVSKDYTNVPLGGLTEAFERYSGNSALAALLRAFSKERNFVAHEAVAKCIDRDGELDASANDVTERLRIVEEQALELKQALHEALNVIRARLDFDDLDSAGG